MNEINSLFDVQGKVALITGATGGFGAAVAKGLARTGVKVMATGRSMDKLTPLVKEIEDAGGTAAAAAGRPDVHADVKRIVAETQKTFGGIDILITAAGMNKPGPITEQPLEEWEMILDANVKGTYLFCREVGKAMIAQGRGG